MILGAVLAGGRSSRFGSDKALAELNGRTLLARAVDQLQPFCDAVIIVGRSKGPAHCIADWPAPDAGPLGGFAGALNFARANGYASVLTCGVDSVDIPDDLPDLLSPPPLYIETQPVIGHWPASAADALERLLLSSAKHSVRAFAEMIGARAVTSLNTPANINTPADLKAAQERRHGL
ncbi:molybdenum cofactor guanylyltransferase [Novosphingobium olei]|uniref:molybdenum cofactor guanylyltransferase n=1 Tax=Novosphingobium olei TaxID=2728851 RepID=UPI00308919FA|nr:molybdenum cofactor guanylyltransferase [Novosphingobium olei]